MKLVAALASLLLVGNAPSSLQVFVEQGVKPGARTEVLMLQGDGDYSGITSIAKRGGRDRGRLDTTRGYWFHCGSWRALPGGRLAVHRQLTESFSYLPPPDPGRWSTTVFSITQVNGGRRLIAGGKTFAQVARAPLDEGWATGESQACDAARRRAPRAD